MQNPLVVVLLPFCLTPIVSFLVRIVTATIAPDLIHDFGLDPATLGLLSSAYFAGFGAMQLPLGILLDRYGPRRVAAALMCVGAAGCAIFALGQSVAVLTVGRALMGVGMAGSVMAGLKAANLWWPRERLPLFNGILFGMTGVGGMLATVPLAALLHAITWREAVFGIGAMALAVGAVIFFVVPDREGPPAPRFSLRAQLAELRGIYGSALFWRYTPLGMTAIGAFSAYQSLWAAIWLRDIAGDDRAGQAMVLFLMLGATVIGNFGFGALSQLLRRYRIEPIAAVLCGIGLAIAVQLALALQVETGARVLWVAWAVLSGCPIALYAIVGQRFPVALVGRVNTAMNMLGFFSSFSLQWGIGVVIGLFPTDAAGGYDPAGHRLAFLLVIALQVAAVAWFLGSRPRRSKRHGAELEAGRPEPLP